MFSFDMYIVGTLSMRRNNISIHRDPSIIVGRAPFDWLKNLQVMHYSSDINKGMCMDTAEPTQYTLWLLTRYMKLLHSRTLLVSG